MKYKQLSDVEFRIPPPGVGDTCPTKRFSLPHSTVVDNKSPPMILPGASVTILCDPGYGIPSLDYYPYQVVKCLTDHPTTPGPCQRKPPDAPNLLELAIMVVIVLVVVLVMGGVCVLPLCKKRNKRKECNDRHCNTDRPDSRDAILQTD